MLEINLQIVAQVRSEMHFDEDRMMYFGIASDPALFLLMG